MQEEIKSFISLLHRESHCLYFKMVLYLLPILLHIFLFDIFLSITFKNILKNLLIFFKNSTICFKAKEIKICSKKLMSCIL